MKIKVSQYIADFLVNNGIRHCFTVTGGGAMHLNDALGHKQGLQCIYNHHEQGCAIAAEAYARYSGNIAAVCVTTGPGGTNALTGVLGGWQDSVPMLILSGQVKRETTVDSCAELHLRQLGDQEFQIVETVQKMTKYAVSVQRPEEIAFHLEKALFLANEGRKAPVWLDIPLDVQGAYIETDALSHFQPEKEYFWNVPEVSDTIVSEILTKIKNAEAPLLLAGSGIRSGNAAEDFLKLIEKLGIPVVTAWNSGDLLSFDNPYFVGMPSTVGIRSGNFAVQNCDLLISLGCRLNIRMIGYNHYDFAKNAYKIIIDIDPRELYKPTVRAEMPVHADVRDVIQKMLASDYTRQPKHDLFRNWCRDLLFRYPAVLPEYAEKEKPLNPYVFIDKLFEKLTPQDKIVCGNGSACVMTFQTAKIKQGQRMFTNSGCASMGYGLPAALGTAVCDNSFRTICIDGDGSIMMNLQELATIAYNQLNIKIFVLNNNGYHSIRQTQRNLFKGAKFVGIDKNSGVGFPNFGILAKAFGLDYACIASISEIDKADSCLNSDKPCLIEVIADPEQDFAPKSSSKVLPDGQIVSPSLDDMAPFLERDEFSAISYLRKKNVICKRKYPS